eukprot:7251721-Lingulodinium_polyedra.AAC.1
MDASRGAAPARSATALAPALRAALGEIDERLVERLPIALVGVLLDTVLRGHGAVVFAALHGLVEDLLLLQRV